MPIAEVTIGIEKTEEEEEPKKLGTLEVHFIRLPGVSDDYIKNGLTNLINGVLYTTEIPGSVWVENPRLSKIDDLRWICTFDLVGYETKVVQMGGIGKVAALIAGLVIGIILAGVIIYWVKVVPLEAALEEVSKTISEVEDEIDRAVKEGLIDEETAEELKDMLGEAREKARAAGEPEWWEQWVKYFEPVFKVAPMFIMLIFLLILLSYLPRRE